MAGAYGYAGPGRDFRATPVFDPVLAALDEERQSRTPTGGGTPLRVDTSLLTQQRDDQDASDRFAATVATTPGFRSSRDPMLADGAGPDEWERVALQPKTFRRGGFGGEDFQFDPRLALGNEAARERQARTSQAANADVEGQARLHEQDSRVQRLVAAGYAPKEAVRQVHGGARTVAEEQELINTRSTEQLERDKFIQGEIRSRQEGERTARTQLQGLLERSRSGDRAATRELQRAKILLDQANRDYKEAQRSQYMNALGVDMNPAGGGSDDELKAVVDQHLSEVGSINAAQHAKVTATDGVRTAGKDAAPGAQAPLVTDDDIESVIAAPGARRQPAPVGASRVGGPAAKPAAAASGAGQKALTPKLLTWATGDPAKKQYLAGQGFDVSKVP